MKSHKRKAPDAKLDAVLFARLYMESWASGHTLRQFAERVGMSVNGVRSRLYFYRKKGWKPPQLHAKRTGGRQPLNVAAMNAIVAEVIIRPDREHGTTELVAAR